jgi:hypothetical protein
MPRPRKQDAEVLQAALIGLQRTLDGVEQNIADLRRRLGGHSDSQPTPAPARRTMSAAARKRIGLAQKKRWAAFKAKSKKAAEPEAQPKREMSAEGRARIVAATKKRWAAFRKAQKAAAKQPAPTRAAKKAPRAKATVAAVAPPPPVPAVE